MAELLIVVIVYLCYRWSERYVSTVSGLSAADGCDLHLTEIGERDEHQAW